MERRRCVDFAIEASADGLLVPNLVAGRKGFAATVVYLSVRHIALVLVLLG